jgi:hypothetical protein
VKCPKCARGFTAAEDAVAAEVVEESVVEIDEPDGDGGKKEPRAKKRKKRPTPKGRSWAVPAVLGGLLFLAVAAMGTGYWWVNVRAISEKVAGENWDATDVMQFLEKQGGLKFTPSKVGGLTIVDRGFFLFKPGVAQARDVTQRLAATPAGQPFPVETGVVHMQRKKSSAEAREAAAKGTGSEIVWGKFVFTGDPAFLEEIRQVLPK